jgi:molybdopterin-synthase adenylyltransferase
MRRTVLSEAERIRYARQILYPDFGETGQEKLARSHAVVAGVGGLGSSSAVFLASSGVGHITLIDCDTVVPSNLNRQILHWDEDVGVAKVSSAAKKLARLNPTISITQRHEKITAANVRHLLEGADVVIDGLDSFEARHVVNAGCVAGGIPFVHGGIHGMAGTVTTIIPGNTACLACFFPAATKHEDVFPAFSVTPGFIAALQAAEALKLLAGFGCLLTGIMLYFDGGDMQFNTCPLVRIPGCSVCGATVDPLAASP